MASLHTTPLPSSWSASATSPYFSDTHKQCLQGYATIMEATDLDRSNPLSAASRHFLYLWKTGPTPTPQSELTNPTLPPPQNVLPTPRSLNSCAFTNPSLSLNPYYSNLLRSVHTLFNMGVRWPCVSITYLTAPSISLAFVAHTTSLFAYKYRCRPSPKYPQQQWPGLHGFVIKLLNLAIMMISPPNIFLFLSFLLIWAPAPSSNGLVIWGRRYLKFLSIPHHL